MKIDYCPSTLAEGFHTYSPAAIKQLFSGHGVSHILNEGDDAFLTGAKAGTAMRRISVSGAQEKFPAVIGEGRIRIAGDEEQSTYILKPYPWDELLLNRKQIPANEHLTMQIAFQAYGILTAANGLCFTGKGQPVYVTRRFDIKPDLTKSEMEDFASLVGRNEQTDGKYFKYSGCYEDIANAIMRFIPAWMVDMERFFDLVTFNYIYGNGDDHLKNFSVCLKYGFSLKNVDERQALLVLRYEKNSQECRAMQLPSFEGRGQGWGIATKSNVADNQSHATPPPAPPLGQGEGSRAHKPIMRWSD